MLFLYAPKSWITTKGFPAISLFDWLLIPKYAFDYNVCGFFFFLNFFYTQKIVILIFTVFIPFANNRTYIYDNFTFYNRLKPL